ncbi:MAG: DoxX family protein [Bacteroidota bacterium]|nr:DoxX family protein [Bacteroidota bacterium]
MQAICKKSEVIAAKAGYIPLLLIRLVLAYGFLGPAMMKWNDIHAVGDWFGTIGIPAPHFNAYLAAITESAGVLLLFLGLGTRYIAVPLIVVMLVAIRTAHWGNGFEAGNNGFEIPLYYIIMLLTLISFGPGKISIDNFITKKVNHQTSE